jgi:hypothetical protein
MREQVNDLDTTAHRGCVAVTAGAVSSDSFEAGVAMGPASIF